ncbi:hypothetical protein ANTPLA_LOCUS3766 [Anthophora plagiata]
MYNEKKKLLLKYSKFDVAQYFLSISVHVNNDLFPRTEIMILVYTKILRSNKQRKSGRTDRHLLNLMCI